MDPTTLLANLKPEAKNINTAMQEDIRAVQDGLLREVLEHSLFNGGKRVRPLLSVFCGRLCGCEDDALYNLARERGAWRIVKVTIQGEAP